MIVSSRNLGAKICEIPIDFLKEPEGRISHQRRNGWTTPFKAGWGTLRVTASFSLDRFLAFPGFMLGGLGVLVNIFLFIQNFLNWPQERFGLYTSSMLAALSLIGWGMFAIGVLSHFVYYPSGRLIKILAKQRLCNRLFAATVFSTLICLTLAFMVFKNWIQGSLILFGDGSREGLLLVISFNLLTQIASGLLAILACSFIAGYLDKLRSRQNSRNNAS